MRHIWSALTVLGMFVFLCGFYGDVLLSPADHLFSASGDGLKNYFVYAWQVAHESDLMTCRGSNHPYGELVVFTDGHPALGWLFQILSVPATQAIGVLNMLLLLGHLLCAWCLYRIAERHGLSGAKAAMLAIGITALQPQLGRLAGGHLSLGHCWAIPLGWWMVIKVQRTGLNWKWAFGWVMLNVLLFFTHPYLGIMVVGFGALVFLVDRLLPIDRIQRSKWWSTLLVLVVPVLIFKGFISIVDHHVERPALPGISMKYISDPAAVLLPTEGPVHDLFLSLIPKDAQQGEGRAYVGIVTGILLLLALIQWVFGYLRRRAHTQASSQLQVAMIAALILLLFSFGVPMRWLPVSLSDLPIIGQFRSVGRFAWPFYHVSTLFAGVWLARQLDRSGWPRSVVFVLWLVFPLSLLVESSSQHRNTVEAAERNPQLFNEENLNNDLHALIDLARKQDAAAIIPLPYYLIGPEVYYRHDEHKVKLNSLLLAYHSRTPVMAGITARTSLVEARNWYSMLFPDHVEKPLRKDLEKDQQFLVYWSHEELDHDEQRIMDRAKVLLKNDEGTLGRIDHRELFRSNAHEIRKRYEQMVLEYGSLQGPLWDTSGCEVSASEQVVLLNMDRADEAQRFIRVHTLSPGVLHPGREYELVLVASGQDLYALDRSVRVESKDERSGEVTWLASQEMRAAPLQVDDHTWVRLRFVADSDHLKHLVVISRPNSLDRGHAVHGLLIRPVCANVYWMDEEQLYFNGTPVATER